ncbi:MAG: hypothetical protein EOP11_24500 [Proteobacteria bacterium]|nr:MAG: hypothetical protein EOP11_24500 [Pseudomonadota bacterium]
MELKSPPPRPDLTKKGIYLLVTALALGLPRTAIESPMLLSQASRMPNGLVILIASQLFAFAIVGGLLFLIYRRHNWARWSYSVLTILGIPFSVYPLYLSLSAAPVSGLIGIGQIFLQLAGLFLLFRPVSSAWFKWRAAQPD